LLDRAEQLELISGPRMTSVPDKEPSSPLRVAGLFAGIGGLERGLAQSGHEAAFFSEIDPSARAVLNEHFPGVPVVPDVRDVGDLFNIDLVAAGFPCQDLSQAGRTIGIDGEKSGLVGEVLRLLRDHDPRWLLLENVPFMLALDGGRGMLHLTTCLDRLGFRWAYRVVDTRAFGLPQRRQRVLLLASRSEDPRHVLCCDNEGAPKVGVSSSAAFGFYWTEGNRGLGWAIDAVPTLKAGSTVGIPSPPAVWVPSTGEVGTPDIRDAERLQGFPIDWTAPASTLPGARKGARWRLVGNAVSVPVAGWLGRRLRTPGHYDASLDPVSEPGERWPRAAWSMGASVHRATVTDWPLRSEYFHLKDFLAFPLRPLSVRATAGFFKRASNSSLRFVPGFLPAVERHLQAMKTGILAE
jgi:DNA (cytosine-5)-methyltransferase 1